MVLGCTVTLGLQGAGIGMKVFLMINFCLGLGLSHICGCSPGFQRASMYGEGL